MLKLLDKVSSIIQRKSFLKRIVGAVAWGVFRKQDDATLTPTVKQLKDAENLVFMAATRTTDRMCFKRFKPVRSKGVLVTEGGRLAKLPMLLLTGKTRLPLLEYSNPLARVIMREAHEEDHFQADMTLERSRSTAWIAQGGKLAKAVCKACMWCRLNNPVRLQQAI